jgi:hypothetical protein
VFEWVAWVAAAVALPLAIAHADGQNFAGAAFWVNKGVTNRIIPNLVLRGVKNAEHFVTGHAHVAVTIINIT